MTTDKARSEEVKEGWEKYRPLRGVSRWIVIIFAVITAYLGADTVFDLRFFVGYMMYDYTLYYLILGLLLSICFLLVPPKPGLKGVWARRLFWVDIALFFLSLGFSLYLSYHGLDVIQKAWSRVAPLTAVIAAVILMFLLIEAVRRAFGMVLGVFILIVALYPLFAQYMPGILEGVHRPFDLTAQFHMLSKDSAMGLLVRLYVRIVLGFTIFGVAIIATGGGKFFLNLALALVGHTRGGTAKVAVFASAMFGSVNGQPIVNVITTGSVTIPAMKKAGFAPHVAGAIETCSSTAGTFTPPIMGLSAFVMASFLNVQYPDVALAAAVPAVLYYVGLFTQIDGYSVKNRLLGLSKEERPSLIETLKYGWFYLPVAAVLLYYLFFLRLVGESAYIATGLVLVLAQIRKESRFTRESFLQFLENMGQTLMQLFVVMAGVGMLLGSFSITGLAVTFARELLLLAGGSVPLMLILCAVASLIMGMAMTLIACYVFLAIVIAPALIQAGIDPMAAHLFVLYCGMLSYITPPVALCAFPAAAISGAPAMRVGLTAVRMGGAIYLLPFFFVLDPSLILHGGAGGILLAASSTFLAIFLIGSAFEGYLLGVGKLWPAKEGGWSLGGYSLHSYLLRGALIAAGFLLGLPWLPIKGLGLAIAAAILVPMFLMKFPDILARVRKLPPFR